MIGKSSRRVIGLLDHPYHTEVMPCLSTGHIISCNCDNYRNVGALGRSVFTNFLTLEAHPLKKLLDSYGRVFVLVDRHMDRVGIGQNCPISSLRHMLDPDAGSADVGHV